MKSDNECHQKHINYLCDTASRLHSLGQYTQSFDLYKSILSDFPDNLRALHGIGVVLHKLGKSDEGIASIKKALVLKPDFASAYNNLGNIYSDLRNYVAAIACFERVLHIEPDNDAACRNLALACMRSGSLDIALDTALKAVAVKPENPDNYMVLGNAYSERGDVENALKNYSNALKLAPNSLNAHTNVLFTMNFISSLRQQDIYRESRKWGQRHADRLVIRRPYLHDTRPERRLRIGYVSGDFKNHPVSYHFKPVLEQHNKNNFEIYLYSNFYKFDDMTNKLMNSCHQWRNIESLSDEQVDEMIRLDGIDILVDLSGHTGLNRLPVFAHKPAPVQVSWIGYCNTTGMKAMDYLISDPVTILPGEERWFSEQIVRLPTGRFCYEPPSFAPDVASLPALRNGFITFGSFNKRLKITPETVSLWSSVITTVQGSHMILKTVALATESVKQDLLEQFKKHGVAPERIEIRKESPHPQMLAEYGDIDISLDTFPFNGGATTCESLWMGVPVLTLTGRTPISRQSASILASCGLEYMLVAHSRKEFLHKVQNLVSDLDVLSGKRETLRSQVSTSTLCNSRLFVHHLEREYRTMWHAWCHKQVSSSFSHTHTAITAGEYYNAGINQIESKNYLSAIHFFKLAIRKNKHFIEAYNNLGISLAELGKEFRLQAIQNFKKAIRLNPSFGEAYNNLGKVLLEANRYAQAIKTCQKAIKLMPENSDAYLNLGSACREKGLLLEAFGAFEIAGELNPDSSEVPSLIAGLKLSKGDAVGAIEDLMHARTLNPCDASIQSNILFAMNYVPAYSQKDIFDASCYWDACYGGEPFGLDFSDRTHKQGRLKIGYVSADFHYHPVGIFFQAIARHHNRQNMEIFCYSNKHYEDESRKEIAKYAEHWQEIGHLSDEETCALIQRDKIDILVDLSGHTAGHRLTLFSRRAAPLQVSWLGYFNTTGLAAMDYVISDSDTVPPGCEEWYREAVLRMPHSRFCYTPPLICPDVEALPALKNGYLTFGSFNNIAKLTPEVIEVWAAILKRLPTSKLVLKWKTLSDSAIRHYYKMLFSIYDIPARQIEFRGQSPLFMMRDEYNDIDIALDPFPYTGGLTSCEALWMGVPVITLAGDRPVSRQTKGLLRIIGLVELSTDTLEKYIQTAVNLANNTEKLSVLRQGLRQRMEQSPLCDGVAFTRTLEETYQTIWQSWRENLGAHASHA